jgi:hypothetical protein
MLRAHGDWMPLGAADEQKPAAEGTIEAWGRSPDNPVGGWYGLKKGLRGRFGVYVPPVLAALGLAELEDAPRSNRMRALERSSAWPGRPACLLLSPAQGEPDPRPDARSLHRRLARLRVRGDVLLAPPR